MIFPTLDFLLFLLVVFAVVWLINPSHLLRKLVLLGASLLVTGEAWRSYNIGRSGKKR